MPCSSLAWLSSPSSSFKGLRSSYGQPSLWATTDAVSTPSSSGVAADGVVGPPLPINQDFPGLQRVYSNPDIYIVRDFLDADACTEMIRQASHRGMAQSPVAYAGWTQDIQDLADLAARGPVAWCSLAAAWWQLHDQADATQLALVQLAVRNFFVGMGVAGLAIVAYTKSRADSLQQLRTSTSTTLDDLHASPGAKRFVQLAAQLFANRPQEASYFEAPTIIRYEPGQQLAPHFDANRSAGVEDANRGGQTLATLLVYLNDVSQGGLTRFGRLDLTVTPKRGDALLFFPADAAGRFDERTEHEGCEAVDEKWIARIWRHAQAVPPPFGLSDTNLARLEV